MFLLNCQAVEHSSLCGHQNREKVGCWSLRLLWCFGSMMMRYSPGCCYFDCTYTMKKLIYMEDILFILWLDAQCLFILRELWGMSASLLIPECKKDWLFSHDMTLTLFRSGWYQICTHFRCVYVHGIHFLKFTSWNSLFDIQFLIFTLQNSFYKLHFTITELYKLHKLTKFTFKNSLSNSIFDINFSKFTFPI